MELKIEDLKEIMQIIETADEFVPVVKVAVEKSNNLLSELRPLLDNFIDYLSDSKIKMVNKYVDNGFTKGEAILMTLDPWTAFRNSLNNAKSKQGK